jgi:hypothetical protein
MKLGPAAALLLATLGSTAVADPTPPGKLLHFDGMQAVAPKVRDRMKAATVTPHAISYRLSADPKTPLAWQLVFGTVEDPETHYHYIHDLDVVLLENKQYACTASTSDLVVDADKVSFPDAKPRAAMMVTVSVACERPDGYHKNCGGGVLADGTAPHCPDPYDQKGIK